MGRLRLIHRRGSGTDRALGFTKNEETDMVKIKMLRDVSGGLDGNQNPRRGDVIEVNQVVADDLFDREQPWAEPADGFDPSDHTVAEVNDYLASADDDEIDRVLKAERDGKDRATVADPRKGGKEYATDDDRETRG